MGFTPALIIAPNVPDTLDTLNFLTSTPMSKLQEQAQEQALLLASARKRGISVREIEQMLGFSSYRTKIAKLDTEVTFSRERKEQLQADKRAVIPQVPDCTCEKVAATLEYPYLFVNSRSKLSFAFTTSVLQSDPHPAQNTTQIEGTAASYQTNKTDPRVIQLSLSEFSNFDADLIERYKTTIDEQKIVIFRMEPVNFVTLKIPFNFESTAVQVNNQLILNKNNHSFDLRNVKRGFFRALIRYHTSYGGIAAADSVPDGEEPTKKKRLLRLPFVDQKPVDYFTLFHLVESRGGPADVTKRKEWAQIGRELKHGGIANTHLSGSIRRVYAKVVEPFSAWLRLHADMDLRSVPQLDVVDDAAKRTELLANDSWKLLSYGIVVLARGKPIPWLDRKQVNLAPLKNPAFTLKSYRSQFETAATNADESIPGSSRDKAAEFEALPEFYITDKILPVKLYAYPDYVATSREYAKEKSSCKDSLGDISDLPLRGSGKVWPNLIHESLDDVLIPRFNAGSRFSSTDLPVSSLSAYRASILLHQSPSTWIVDGVFIEQCPSDIVVVSPTVKATCWRQDFNCSVDLQFLLADSWLDNAMKSSLIQNPTSLDAVPLSLQKLVKQICLDEGYLDLRVKRQVLDAIPVIAKFEAMTWNRYQDKYCPNLKESGNRVEFQEKMVFSCMEQGNKILSAEEYHTVGVDGENSLKLFTVYGTEPNIYFQKLAKQVEARPSTSQEAATVIDMLAKSKGFPTLGILDQALAITDGAEQDTKNIELSFQNTILRTYVENVVLRYEEWLSLNEVDRIDQQRNLLEVDVESADPRHNITQNSLREFLVTILNKLNSLEWNLEQAALLAQTGTELLELFKGSRNLFKVNFLKEVTGILRWIVDVNYLVDPRRFQKKPPTYREGTTITDLKAEGRNFDQAIAEPYQVALNQYVSWAEADRLIWETLNGPEATNVALLGMRLHTLRGLGPEYHKRSPWQILVLAYDNKHVFSQMEALDVRQRPTRSSVRALGDIPVIRSSLRELDIWLESAKNVPWGDIFARLQAIMVQSAPQIMAPVYKSTLFSTYGAMFSLRIVPDDLMEVKATFEQTIRQLEGISPAILAQFGILP